MNKIFKVIYSKTKHMYVVASELAKSHSKSKNEGATSGKALAALVMAALASVSFMAAPMDAQAADKTDTTGWQFIGIWHNTSDKRSTSENYQPNDIAVNDQGAIGEHSITIGVHTQAGPRTIVIGDRLASTSQDSVFIGSGYDANGVRLQAKGGSDVVVIGSSGDATGTGSIALGYGASADPWKNNSDTDKTNANKNGNSIALGYKAQAENNNIAIGANSVATAAASTENAKFRDTTASDYKAPTSYVSVGSSTNMRRITNVAAGSDANDAATVGQLEKVAAQKGSWQLTAGKTNATTVDGDNNTVDFSAGSDGNLSVSKTADTNDVTIGLKKDVILGQATSGNGGSLDVYRAVGDASSDKETNKHNQSYDQLGSHVRIDGSTVSIHYDNGTDNSDARGAVLGIANDSYKDTNDTAKTVSSPLGYVYLQDGKNFYYLHGAMHGDTNYQGRLAYDSSESGYNYIANLDDGLKFTGDTENTTVETKLDPNAANNTLSIKGGVTDSKNLTSDNIGVVAKANTTDEKGHVTSAGGLTIQLAKDLTGITSITSQTTGSTTGAKVTLDTADNNIDVNKGKVTNLTDGTVNATSTDAVTGKQLYNLDNSSVKYDTNGTTVDKTKITLAGGTTGTTITNVKAGTISENSTEAINGAQLYAEQQARDKAISNAKTKYYSVQEGPQIGSFNTNADNTGATASRIAGLAAGYETGTTGIASTVAGSYSGVIGSGLQGAAAVSLGTVNVNYNTDTNKATSGVANSIVGQANVTKDSNAALIYGAGNSVTDSYRELDTSALSKIKIAVGNKDAKALESAVQSAVPKSGAQVMVMGGGNNITRAYMTQVIGVGNTITGKDATYAEDTSTQYNYVDGSNNTLTNGKGDYIIGANNSVTGDSITKNQSNIVVGDNHTLSNKSNNVVIGSADSQKELAAFNAVVIGHNADVQKDGGVAIGSDSVASIDKGVTGYDPETDKVSTAKTGTWKATNAAVSVGKADGSLTRQITGVAAGTADTDAVNVAQIKKLGSKIGLTDTLSVKYDETGGSGSAGGSITDYSRITLQGQQGGTTILNLADGTRDDAAVNLSQLRQKADLDAGNIGSHYTPDMKDENGDIIYYSDQWDTDSPYYVEKSDSKYGTPVKETDKDKIEDAQRKNENSWGTAIGTGKIADAKASDASSNGSQQLVTGGTVYSEVRPADGTYVKKNKTTAENLTALDKQMSDMDGSAVKYDTTTVDGKTTVDKTKITLAGGTTGTTITNVKSALNGATDISKVTEGLTNAVNLSDLQTAYNALDKKASGAHTALTVEGKTVAATEAGKYAGKNIQIHSDTDATTGKVTYDVKLANDLTDITSISGGSGDKDDKGAKITLDAGDKNISVNNGKITKLAAGEADDDAATVKQVNDKVDAITYTAGDGIKMDSETKKISAVAGTGITVDTNGISVNTGKHLNINTSGQIDVDDTGEVAEKGDKSQQLVTGKTVYDALHGGLDSITVGKDGQNGKDGSIGIAGKDGKDGYTMTIIKTEQGAAGVDGKDGITRVIYQDKDGKNKHTIATLDDGLKFKGDDSTVIAKKLDEQLDITGGADSTKLTDKNIGVNNVDGKLKIQLAKDLTGITSITSQTTDSAAGGKITFSDKGTTISGGDVSVDNHKITNIAEGTDDNDAATVKQVTDKIGAITYKAGDGITMDTTAKTISAKAGNGITVDTNGINAKAGTGITVDANGISVNTGKHLNINTSGQIDVDDTGEVAEKGDKSQQLVTGKTVYDALHGGLDSITVGKDGQNGKDGSIGIAGKDGKDGYTMTIIKTEQGAAGVDGKDGITRVIYQDKDGKNKHTIATLDDGLKFKGDDSTVIAKKLDEQLDITGGADSTKLTDKNIGVNNVDGKLKIQLAKDLTGITSITSQTTDSAAGGKISFSDKGTTISGGDVSVSNNKITNLAPGTADTDAATVKQVNAVDAKADANSAAIKTNSDNIEKNGKSIEQNSAAIKTNSDNIEKNGKAIEKNSAAIKTNADNIEKNGKAIEQNSAAIKTNSDNIEKNGKAIEQNSAAIKTNSDNIEKISKTVEQNSAAIKTNADNIEKNSKAIEKNSTAIKTNSDNIEKNGKAIEKNSAAIKTNSDNIEKISKTVEQTTSQVATNSNNIEKNGKAIEQNSAAIKTNSDNIEKNSAAIESLGQNKANIDASNIGKNMKDADGKAASTDAAKANEDAWGDAIGTGKVESGNKQLVTGDTVYNELRPTDDGSYIKKDNTTAQNLVSLDTQVKKTADLINSDGSTIKIGGSDKATKIDISGKDSGGSTTARIITGVQTDAQDATSAANVGYVNDVAAANTQQIYREMHSAYGHLNNNINKAAAGSNALAALHPLDYDPADKASYAVGYGHYRNANAAAVGAFYQPNANTMVSVGVSMGNGDPGVNAGVSFKVGKGSAYNGVSKAQMAETIAAQEKQISEIKASDVAKDQRIDSLEKENQEMKKQIQEILAKLGK